MKFLISVVLLVGLFWWFWGRTMAPVSVIDGQLAAISKNDWMSAYDVLADETKAATPFVNFRETILANEIIAANANAHLYDRVVEGNFATISGTVETWDQKKVQTRYVLIKKGDKWVIKEFYINNVRTLPIE